MSISLVIGNFLYKYSPSLYRLVYTQFKNRQDAKEIAFLKQNIKAGNYVLDIGANIGFYSNIIATCVGTTGIVHAFEPDRTNFAYLERNTLQHQNIVLNNKAVGSKTGKLKIYTSGEINVDHRTYAVENYKDVYEIDSIAMDDYFAKNEEIHFVKMDIQGFELEALQGMANLIRRCKPKILLEFWPHGIEASGHQVEDYFKFIEELGYSVQLLENGQAKQLNLDNISRFKGQSKEHYYNIFLN